MTACVHRGAARCWACMLGDCYPTPQPHPWWDYEDVADAEERGLPAPSGDCGCAWCGTPAIKGGERHR